MRVLVVSINDELVKNIKTWFRKDIDSGSLTIHHAKNKDIAREFLSNNSYDVIFHNSINIISEIEEMQKGARTVHIDKTSNDIYSNTVDPGSRGSVSKSIFGIEPRISVSTLITIIILFVSVIATAVNLIGGVQANAKEITRIEKKFDRSGEEINKRFDKLEKNISENQQQLINLLTNKENIK